MRKTALLRILFAVLVFSSFASAQQGDAYFGGGTLVTTGSSCTLNSSANLICPQHGGTYLNLGADLIFMRRIGAAFDINWKASQGNFGGLGVPCLPLLFSSVACISLALSQKTGLDLGGGIGWQSTRCCGYQRVAAFATAFLDPRSSVPKPTCSTS